MGNINSDHFYADNGIVIWIYYNPQAVSGGQFVVNYFDKEVFEEAIAFFVDESGEGDAVLIMSDVEENCRQELCDIGTDDYEWAKAKYESKPNAIGINPETVIWIYRYLGCHS